MEDNYGVSTQEITEKWTTKTYERYLELLENGVKLKHSPFHDNNSSYKKGNLVFNLTQEELKEMYKCMKDIVYFADNYCHVMTDDGIRNIKLRDYQKPVLKSFSDPKERQHILVAPRQIGKCFVYNTEINLKENDSIKKIEFGELFYKSKKVTILSYIKKLLYNILNKL